VRNILGVVALAFGISVLVPLAGAQAPPQQAQQGNQQQMPQTAPQPAQQIPPPPNPTPTPVGPIIVLDPAHGGTDTGARGQNAVMEKDLVLQMARGVKAELERQGFRVVMTRNDDSNPSYDDRAAMANAYRDAIFVSLHVASTGTVGSIRTYYEQMSAPEDSSAGTANAAGKVAPPPVSSRLNSWNDAQRAYLNASHHLADLMQIVLVQRFGGSQPAPLGAAVRELRSVAAPAVAIELSSVSAPDPNTLANSAVAPLAEAIARAVSALRATSPGGAKQ